MDLTALLDECLDRLAIGETVASCLARYPQHARDLEPMLRAAQQVRALSELHLTYGQRTRGKMALRDGLTPREKRSRGVWWGWFQPAPVAFVLAVVLFIGAAFTTVAASRPGDLAYPVRIAAEQVGVWVRLSAYGRANSEVDAAARRLGDLEGYLAHTGEFQPLPLDAMLRNEEAAARRAQALTDEQRVALAGRIASHVDELNVLADGAVDPEVAQQLRLAAVQVGGLVVQLRTRPDAMPVVDVLVTPTQAGPTPSRPKTPGATATPKAEQVERSPVATAPLPTVTALAGRTRTRLPQPGPSAAPTINGPTLSPLPAETPYRQPTAVASVTSSATVQASSTWTPWPTGTPTVTRTRWFSVTPSPTRTAGAAPTATRTLPIISTRTRAPMPVETMTVPVLPILSATPKGWPTVAPSQTTTPTPTPTWTQTLVAPTATPTLTETSAPDVWATATARVASSATITPTALPTQTPTMTLSPTPPPTIRWLPIPTVTVVGPAPTATVTVVMPPFLTRTAEPPVGTATITVTPRRPRPTEVGATPTSTPTRARRSH